MSTCPPLDITLRVRDHTRVSRNVKHTRMLILLEVSAELQVIVHGWIQTGASIKCNLIILKAKVHFLVHAYSNDINQAAKGTILIVIIIIKSSPEVCEKVFHLFENQSAKIGRGRH